MLAQYCLAACFTLLVPAADDKTNDRSQVHDDVVAEMDSKEIRRSDIEPSEKVLAEVKPDDRDRTAKQMRADALRGKILGPLTQEYSKKHKIEATDEEIDSFNEHLNRSLREAAKRNPALGLEKLESNDREAQKAKREVARMMVVTWKLSKELYEEFGGEVIFQQANPTEPVGAYRKLLERAEKKGRFKISDPVLRDDFWAYFSPKGHTVIPKERADKLIQKPWWEQKASDILGSKAILAPDGQERR